MTTSSPKYKYEDLMLPEHLALVHASAHGDMSVPIFASGMEVIELLKMTAKDLLSGKQMRATAQAPTEEQWSGIDQGVAKAMRDPKMITSNFAVSDNPLPTVFALLGYASGLGRTINLIAAEALEDGSVSDNNGFRSQLNPRLFTEFSDKPLEGAQILFSNIFKRLNMPQRMAVVAILSPGLN